MKQLSLARSTQRPVRGGVRLTLRVPQREHYEKDHMAVNTPTQIVGILARSRKGR